MKMPQVQFLLVISPIRDTFERTIALAALASEPLAGVLPCDCCLTKVGFCVVARYR